MIMDTSGLNSNKTTVNAVKQDGLYIGIKMDKTTGLLSGSVKVDFAYKRRAELCRALNRKLNSF